MKEVKKLVFKMCMKCLRAYPAGQKKCPDCGSPLTCVWDEEEVDVFSYTGIVLYNTIR